MSGGRDGGDSEDARRLIVDGALKSAEGTGNSNLAVHRGHGSSRFKLEDLLIHDTQRYDDISRLLFSSLFIRVVI